MNDKILSRLWNSINNAKSADVKRIKSRVLSAFDNGEIDEIEAKEMLHNLRKIRKFCV